jgi:hypothetical protein
MEEALSQLVVARSCGSSTSRTPSPPPSTEKPDVSMMANDNDGRQSADAEQPIDAQAVVHGTPSTAQASSARFQDRPARAGWEVRNVDEQEGPRVGRSGQIHMHRRSGQCSNAAWGRPRVI